MQYTNKLLGVGSSDSTGINRGSITSREKFLEEMENALVEAEKMANVKVEHVWLSVSGEHIRGINTQGAIAIDGNNSGSSTSQLNKIDENDIKRVLEMAKAISFPTDREILHILPQEYVVDVMNNIKDPIGMSGRRLEARVHLVTVTTSAAENLVNCADELGLIVKGLAFQGLTSGIATIDSDERDMGVVLADIGSKTTDITIYYEGGVRHTGVIPIGADSVTNDIAVMRISKTEAERIKLKYGSAKASMAAPELQIEIPNNENGKPIIITEHELSRYMEARMVEIYQLIGREISRTDCYNKLTYGLVITGGGALLPNAAVLGEEILGIRVRIGVPRDITSSVDITNSPQLASVIGLALWTSKSDDILLDEPIRFGAKDLIGKISTWFRGFF
ncbi:MAG: cell division protein FtsA [Planctomycetia bacterium]|nr:cell division protein FtsA [Planctomycetia bacterium]